MMATTIMTGTSPRLLHRLSSLVLAATASNSIFFSSFCVHALLLSTPSSTTLKQRQHAPTAFSNVHSSHPFRKIFRFSSCRHRIPSASFMCSFSSNAKQTTLEQKMTREALAICHSGINAVNPKTSIQSHLTIDPEGNTMMILNPATGTTRAYSSLDYDKVIVIAFGKASSAMASAVVETLVGSKMVVTDGVVIVKDDHATEDEIKILSKYNVRVRSASHPIPDERSADAADEILSLLPKEANSRTIVINCISGGGSALFCSPRPPLTLEDLQRTNSILLKSGMSIQNMNIIRKKLELGKGGLLVMSAYPSTCVTLVLSDVINDPLDLIASGPTVPDVNDSSSVLNLVENFKLGDTLPPAVLQILRDGEHTNDSGLHPIFTEQTTDRTGKLSDTILVGNNALAVKSAANKAQALGYNPVILGTGIEGEARYIAEFYIAMASQLQKQRSDASSPFQIAQLPVALIAGGETTVTLNSKTCGKGGRNQEIALVAALKMQEIGLRNVILASIGTDGTDGPTDAAGAVVDGGTVGRVESSNNQIITGEKALETHNSYPFFDSLEGPLVKTGPTGTNVADICVTLIR